jgi:hypothetical protein
MTRETKCALSQSSPKAIRSPQQAQWPFVLPKILRRSFPRSPFGIITHLKGVEYAPLDFSTLTIILRSTETPCPGLDQPHTQRRIFHASQRKRRLFWATCTPKKSPLPTYSFPNTCRNRGVSDSSDVSAPHAPTTTNYDDVTRTPGMVSLYPYNSSCSLSWDHVSLPGPSTFTTTLQYRRGTLTGGLSQF